MASRQDLEKRQLWAERLRRYRSSGLTVARFCASERVSVNTFFYWAKRVGAGSTAPSTRPRPSRSGGDAVPLGREGAARAQAAVGSAQFAARLGSPQAVVRFQINAAVEIAVPADCLDAIRCLANCLQHSRGDRRETFQEVVVATR
jgi:hypothetical protein